MTPPGAERREHPRIPVRLVVHYSRGDKPYRLMSENLSLGGIFLRKADDVCAEGETLQLEIVVPSESGEEERHEISGVVVQRLAGSGAGVRFLWDEAKPGARLALERFIDRAGMLNTGSIHAEYVGLATDAEEDR